MKMKIKLSLFYTNLEYNAVKEILPLLEKVESVFDLEIEKKGIKKFGEKKLKSTILWSLAISKRIKIHQTRRTKSLYTQLVVFLNNKPFTFYPQSYGKRKITIKQFLENLLRGEVLCLHDINNLKENLKKK